jgi:hypothetical protein
MVFWAMSAVGGMIHLLQIVYGSPPGKLPAGCRFSFYETADKKLEILAMPWHLIAICILPAKATGCVHFQNDNQYNNTGARSIHPKSEKGAYL